jgi:hypothetical protein
VDARRAWRRLDAEHWVHVWGMVATTLLGLGTLWALFGGWLAGVPLVAVLPAALSALSGWLTSAWRRERPWSWWVWTVGSAVVFLASLNGLAQGRLLGGVLVVASGVLLVLLAHPDSRARIDRSSAELPSRGPVGG